MFFYKMTLDEVYELKMYELRALHSKMKELVKDGVY